MLSDVLCAAMRPSGAGGCVSRVLYCTAVPGLIVVRVSQSHQRMHAMCCFPDLTYAEG